MSNLSKSSTDTSSTIGGKKVAFRSSIGRAITASLTVLAMCLICLSTILIIPPLSSEAAASWQVQIYAGDVSSSNTLFQYTGSGAYNSGFSNNLSTLRWSAYPYLTEGTSSAQAYAYRVIFLTSDRPVCNGPSRLDVKLSWNVAIDDFAPDRSQHLMMDPFANDTAGVKHPATAYVISFDPLDRSATVSLYFDEPTFTIDFVTFPVVTQVTSIDDYRGSAAPSASVTGWVNCAPIRPNLVGYEVNTTSIDFGPVVGGLDEVGHKVEQIGDQISDKVEELGQTIEDVLNPEHDFSGFEDAQAEDAARQAEVKEKINTYAYADEFDDMIDRILDPADELMIPQKLGGVLSLVSESARIITDKMEIKNFLEQLIILGSVGAILGVAVGVPAVIKWGRKKKK